MAKGKDVVPVKKTNLPSPETLKTKLATAKTTGEVKPIITAAKALKVVAKDAKNRQAIADATEVVRRAERKLGQVMAEQKVTVGFNKGGAEKGVGRKGKKNAGLENPALPPTLAEAGIDKNLAYRARKWAEFDDEDFEYELKDELDEILNPPPTWEQREDERKAQKAYERTPEGQAELRRREEERERAWEEDRKKHPELHEHERVPEIEIIEPNGETVAAPATVCAEVILPKRSTQSAAPEIISPKFTAKGAVNQTRFAEAMRSVKQGLRSAYALSDPATFFKHTRDMLDDLERELVPVAARTNGSSEQSVEERRALNAKLAEEDEKQTESASA